MKISFTLALMVFSAALTFAQSVTINQQANLGGTANDVATSIVRTSDGGFVVAGYTNSNNGDVTGAISGEDAWIIKLSSAGALQWKRIFGGSSDDRAHAIVQASNGDYVFAGTTNSSNGNISNAKGAFDAWVVRLNPNGNVIWSRNLGGSDDDAFYSLFEAPNGVIVLGGESKSDIPGTTNRGGYDYYLAAISSTGNTQLQRQYGGGSDDGARAVALLGNTIVLAGTTASDNGQVTGNKGGTDMWVVKVNASGTIQFAKTYGGADNDEGTSIAVTGPNDFFVAGATQSSNGDLTSSRGGRDFFVVRLNANGDKTWARNYGGDSDDIAYTITTTPDGGAAVAGYSTSNDQDVLNNYGSRDQWFAKLSSTGNIQVSKNFGGSDADEARSLIYLGGTSYVMAGYSESDDVDLNNNKGNADYWLHRFTINAGSSIAGLESEATEVVLYPNPAVDFVRVQATNTVTQAILIDLTGKMVLQEQPFNQNFQLNLNGVAPGLYLLQLLDESGERHTSKLQVNRM